MFTPDLLKMMLLNANNVKEFDQIAHFCIGSKALKSVCVEPSVVNHYNYLESLSGFDWNKFTKLFNKMMVYDNENDTKNLLKIKMNLYTMVYDFSSNPLHWNIQPLCTLDQKVVYLLLYKYIMELEKWLLDNYPDKYGGEKKVTRWSNHIKSIFKGINNISLVSGTNPSDLFIFQFLPINKRIISFFDPISVKL